MKAKKAILVFLIAGSLVGLSACQLKDELSNEELWENAVEDAMISEDEEILPLVTLTKEDNRVIWDDAGERVLLLSWHNYDDDCAPGSSFKEEYGDIWATSLGEMMTWYQEKGKEVEDWNLRFAQLLGVHENEGYTRFSAFWVAPEDVIRPAYITDVTKQMENEYAMVGSGPYQEWFDQNIIWSYFQSDYPWTRLGYTYDWNKGESEYGLTEFLISDSAKTEIAFTYTTQEFVNWLAEQTTSK